MNLITFIVLILTQLGFSECENITISSKNQQRCTSTKKYTLSKGIHLNIIINGSNNMYYDLEIKHYDGSTTKLPASIKFSPNVTVLFIIENLDFHHNGTWRIFSTVDTQIVEECIFEIWIKDIKTSELFEWQWVAVGVLASAIAIIIVETYFLIRYKRKVKTDVMTNEQLLKDITHTGTERYSRMPRPKKEIPIDRESQVYECVDDLKIPARVLKKISANRQQPPYGSPESKCKHDAAPSPLRTPTTPPKAKPPAPDPKIIKRKPMPIPTSVSDDEEIYEAPPDYRKSNTLPNHGFDVLDRKVLFDSIMAKKQMNKQSQEPLTELSNSKRCLVDLPKPTPVAPSTRNLPKPGIPNKQQWSPQPGTSTRQLVDIPKPAPIIPKATPRPNNTSPAAQNNIGNELLQMLKKRKELETQPHNTETPKNLPTPVKPYKPMAQPPEINNTAKNKIPQSSVVHQIPEHDEPNQDERQSLYYDDNEWVYEPLQDYHIYSN